MIAFLQAYHLFRTLRKILGTRFHAQSITLVGTENSRPEPKRRCRVRAVVNGPANRQIESLLLDGTIGAWSDDQLLARFADETGGRAERAFEVLVERHGPRVFRVCRAVTGDYPTAEDAFQATFLILARKASSLRVSNSLGPWLHSVAARVAASAKSQRAKRAYHETSAAHRGEPLASDAEPDVDLARILQLEIGGLRAPYREAVYLCDIEGLDHQTAAMRIGCPAATLRTRLFRGRRALRTRLIRRGILPSTIVAASASAAKASLSPRLIEAVSKSAVAIVSDSASGSIPAAVVILFQETITAMLKTKIKMLLGAAALALSVATAAVFAQDKPSSPSANPNADARPADAFPPGDHQPVPRPQGAAVSDDVRPSNKKSDTAQAGVRYTNLSRSKDPNELGQSDAPDMLSNEDILRMLAEKRFQMVSVQLETIAIKREPERNYPQVGRAQLVRTHYKATVSYRLKDGDQASPMVDVLYFDRDTLQKLGTSDKTSETRIDATGRFTPLEVKSDQFSSDDVRKTATNKTGVIQPDSNIRYTARSDAFDTMSGKKAPQDSDTENRLAEVERKLDRILKALERGDAGPQGTASVKYRPDAGRSDREEAPLDAPKPETSIRSDSSDSKPEIRPK